MPIFLLVTGGLFFWLWYSGRLARMQPGDWIALIIAVLGTRVLTTGQLPTAGAMIGGALLWAVYRSARSPADTAPQDADDTGSASAHSMSIAEARMLLGIDERATAQMIRAAYRRRMARAHPDAGGNADLASKLNSARDMLLAHRSEDADSPWP